MNMYCTYCGLSARANGTNRNMAKTKVKFLTIGKWIPPLLLFAVHIMHTWKYRYTLSATLCCSGFFFFLFSQSNVIRILIPKKPMLQQNARSVHNSWPNCNTVLADYRETQWMLRLNWIYVYDVYVYSRNQQLQRSALTANKNGVEKDDTKERELGRDSLRLFFLVIVRCCIFCVYFLVLPPPVNDNAKILYIDFFRFRFIWYKKCTTRFRKS